MDRRQVSSRFRRSHVDKVAVEFMKELRDGKPRYKIIKGNLSEIVDSISLQFEGLNPKGDLATYYILTTGRKIKFTVNLVNDLVKVEGATPAKGAEGVDRVIRYALECHPYIDDTTAIPIYLGHSSY